MQVEYVRELQHWSVNTAIPMRLMVDLEEEDENGQKEKPGEEARPGWHRVRYYG